MKKMEEFDFAFCTFKVLQDMTDVGAISTVITVETCLSILFRPSLIIFVHSEKSLNHNKIKELFITESP